MKLKHRRGAALLLLLTGLLLARTPLFGQTAAAPAGLTPSRNAILVSWDGADRRTVRELLKESKLPNIAALAAEGSFQEIQVVGHATSTKPGHVEMLTGLDALTTGTVTNQKYRPVPEGYTVFERLEQHFGRDRIKTVFLSSKTGNVGGRSPEEATAAEVAKARRKSKTITDTALARIRIPGDTFYLAKQQIDLFDARDRKAGQTGPLALKYLSDVKGNRFFMFIHFADPDKEGHSFGSGSPEYVQAIIECDRWLGKFIEWLKQENLYQSTLVYVNVDHGFDPNATSHSNAPDGWLATNDRQVKRSGILSDVPATIMARFGLDIPALKPRLLGADLAGPVPPDRGLRVNLLPKAGGQEY
ncbi:MAG TPA: alkaline phosphatase family protein [bacterium]|uniref:Type I phosphodiesterase / nucleotide pyrophosphatase n=1 Tax=candidate division TA06 bacterium ADurb.Bin417 TaxID=1852828 RepID=A0A1V5MKX8_UNCT6|nr:MAG: Type I phosphodiesterase / nucleotide pyrophosphatase [candidate division TA06 bacterium ADurb.Bin417]HNQ36078.1 alkaline phosphatase family protein [bacterium]HNS48248.1 alkaline phosphatase family protein [bacterium]